MKNLLFLASVIVLSLSACSKKCVQCEAFDGQNQKVSETQKVCGDPLNIKNFKNRFENSFEEGYTTRCLDVD